MDPQKIRIVFITALLLIAGIIGGWFFLFKTLVKEPEQAQPIQADIQKDVESGKLKVESGEPITSNQHSDKGQLTNNNQQKTGDSSINSGGQTITGTRKNQPVNQQSNNQQSISQRAFRLLLPPGSRPELRKRIVQQIYKQYRIIAIPTIPANQEEYITESQTAEKYSLILQAIDTSFDGPVYFQRDENFVSLFHATAQTRSGGFLSVIPFSIDPMIVLVHKKFHDKLPLSLTDIQSLITKTPEQSQSTSNYIFDKRHSIRILKQKSSPSEFNPLTMTILSQAILENNPELFLMFMRTPQFSSTQSEQSIQEPAATDERCKEFTPLQCHAIVNQPALVRGWMSDLLGGSEATQQQILASYDIQGIPSLEYDYPYQGRGRIVQSGNDEKTVLAQQRVVAFLQRSYSANEDIRPHMFSSYQSVFSQQKNLETYHYFKPFLNSLALSDPIDPSFIDASLLKVLEGSYNPEIWLRKKQQELEN